VSRVTQELIQEIVSLSSTGLSPSSVGSSKNPSTKTQLSYSLSDSTAQTELVLQHHSYNARMLLHNYGLGIFPVRSPLLGKSLSCFLFLRVLRWFTSPGSLLPAYVFSGGSRNLPCEGLPHSEILGSMPVCGSPRLIAADHVLHRLPSPRHPPCALSSLIITYF
jgi:hypothetical protein